MNNLTLKNKQDRARKMMLLLSLLSITMTFGGLTSAYVVSKGRLIFHKIKFYHISRNINQTIYTFFQ